MPDQTRQYRMINGCVMESSAMGIVFDRRQNSVDLVS